jgi:phosphatidylglycerophosphate synthase
MYLADYTLQPLHSIHATPNSVTFASFLVGLASVYTLIHKQYYLSAALFGVSYFFDTIDGMLARKYNQITEFGDWFDHGTDIIVFALILYFIFTRRTKGLGIFIPLLLVEGIGLLYHIKLQEKYVCQNSACESPSLHFITKFVPDGPIEHMKYTRLFGNANIIILTMLLIIRS